MENRNRKGDYQPSWCSHGISHVGKVRRHNEDSMLERPEAGIWAVADGMGGHMHGDIASRMIVDALAKVSMDQPLERRIDDIEDELVAVNDKLIEKARRSEGKIVIGSTVIVLLVYKNYCVYMWAGDSRLYRLRDNKFRRITTDHSLVEQYIAQGSITRENGVKHPKSNVITRAVGAAAQLYVDMEIQEIQKGDRYLLCSDGLTKHVADMEFQDILKKGTAREACQELIDLTLSRGAGDNVTAVLVDIE